MIRVKGNNLGGKVRAIASKSYAHRAIIGAALADGKSKIKFFESSEDIETTLAAIIALGAEVNRVEDGVEITPISKRDSTPVVDASESGTTLRMMLPVAAALYDQFRFRGRGRLRERPIIELMNAMEPMGVSFDSHTLPFECTGKLRSGKFVIPGNISSQYISGLLFATPLLDQASEIELTTKLESKAYVKMTLEILEKFGISIETTESGYKIEPQKFKPIDYLVEGDWSNASFFLVAGALGSEVTVEGLNINSIQGDKEILEILTRAGAIVTTEDGAVTVKRGELVPFDADLSEIPDMLPILAVVAAAVEKGVSTFYNGKRLRLKESDRLKSTADMIRALGGELEETEDGLIIYGTDGLNGGTTDSQGDHRIAMAAAIASVVSRDVVYIKNHEAVSKSYPGFFKDFRMLGGEAFE
ncbi:MAG: 3-phosphoshikimate 1-carboxyvinyltransferase [Gudongella sp.]|jgi:3-phosphoshikimate 1-carboxyvinyltransferase|nr:3-phosphoshikimate 1-carboxyvinyltransferase [Gudongella sp.]